MYFHYYPSGPGVQVTLIVVFEKDARHRSIRILYYYYRVRPIFRRHYDPIVCVCVAACSIGVIKQTLAYAHLARPHTEIFRGFRR